MQPEFLESHCKPDPGDLNLMGRSTICLCMDLQTLTLHRRFDRIGRLLGDEKMTQLQQAHVMVVGVGGVGSWCAESLARSGIGKITLVDFDDICVTNTNRQLHTMTGLIGQKKAKVMAERLQKINPQGKYQAIEKFYSAEASEEILQEGPDLIIDCIDNLKAKSHLIATCKMRGLAVLVAGGGGSRLDPTKLAVADLADTHTDPFLAQLRKDLRTRYDFPENNFGVQAVFSTEAPSEPKDLAYDKGQGFQCVCPQGQNNFHSCERRNIIHGTASFVVGTMGLWLASLAIKELQ